MNRVEEDEYRQFVAARLEPLRVTAYLLCRDWHVADDLVSITIGKLFRHWRQVRVMEHVDAYVRGMLTNAWLDERRRPWRREKVTDNLPDRAEVSVPGSALADRALLLDLLGQLPPHAGGPWSCAGPFTGEDENLPLTGAQLTALALDPAVARVAAEPLRFDTNARRMLIDSWVLASLQRHGVAGLLSVEIRRHGSGTSGDLTCAVAEREVQVLRKDGSWLAVTLAADGAEKLALTAAQQQAIAFDPTIALPDR